MTGLSFRNPGEKRIVFAEQSKKEPDEREGENRHNLQTAFASTTIQATTVWATTIRATTTRTISPFSTTTADPIMLIMWK
jgi:hypothetical protein